MEEVIPDELYDAFREQAVALVDGGADAIVVETMTDLEEAVIAVRAAVENTSVPVFCTMTFDKLLTGEYRTMMGVSPAEMIQPLLDAGASVLGANCGNGMEGMVAIVREIRNINTSIPILIHANAGIPVYRDGETHFPESPCDMAAHVNDLVQVGANIIGGCCGTTPGHISEIRNQILKANL
jgi:5-methyltetrahydrofolate--homocysteine methyltransferase